MTARVVEGVRIAATAPRFALIGAVRIYQKTLSPLFGPRCKYYPSCSHYGLEALQQHGAVRGSLLAAWRVARCNPWSNGGVDDVPTPGQKLFRLSRNNSRMTTPASPTLTSAPLN